MKLMKLISSSAYNEEPTFECCSLDLTKKVTTELCNNCDNQGNGGNFLFRKFVIRFLMLKRFIPQISLFPFWISNWVTLLVLFSLCMYFVGFSKCEFWESNKSWLTEFLCRSSFLFWLIMRTKSAYLLSFDFRVFPVHLQVLLLFNYILAWFIICDCCYFVVVWSTKISRSCSHNSKIVVTLWLFGQLRLVFLVITIQSKRT